MKLLHVALVIIYLLMAQRFCYLWLKFWRRDRYMSLEERNTSLVSLIVGTLFWPIVVPISYLSLLQQKLDSQEAEVEGDKGNDMSYIKNWLNSKGVNHTK